MGKKFCIVMVLSWMLMTQMAFASDAVTSATPAQKMQLTQGIERAMPMALFENSFNLALVQYGIGTITVPKPVNPFDPSFAQCMDDAIKSRSYANAVQILTAEYFSALEKGQIGLDALKADLDFLNNPVVVEKAQKWQNLFARFAKNQSLAENHSIFYSLMQNKNDNETMAITPTKPSEYLIAILTLNEKSAYRTYMLTQINTCWLQQKLY